MAKMIRGTSYTEEELTELYHKCLGTVYKGPSCHVEKLSLSKRLLGAMSSSMTAIGRQVRGSREPERRLVLVTKTGLKEKPRRRWYWWLGGFMKK